MRAGRPHAPNLLAVQLPPPPDRSVASDNAAGAHPAVLDAVARANHGQALAYGDDAWTKECEGAFRELFGDVTTLLTFNGTGANVLALARLLGPAGERVTHQIAAGRAEQAQNALRQRRHREHGESGDSERDIQHLAQHPQTRPEGRTAEQDHHGLQRERHRGERQRNTDLRGNHRQPGHHERREQANAVIESGDADDRAEQRARGFESGGTNGHWVQILAYAYCTDNRRQ